MKKQLKEAMNELQTVYDGINFASDEDVRIAEKEFRKKSEDLISGIKEGEIIPPEDLTERDELRTQFKAMAETECIYCTLTPHAEMGLERQGMDLPLLDPIITQELLDLIENESLKKSN